MSRSLRAMLRWAVAVVAGLAGVANGNAGPQTAPGGTDYYISNKPGSGTGTKDDPFGMADLPGPDTKLTRALEVLQPGDTLWFKGGEYAFRTAPGKQYYYLGYIRPGRPGEPGKPISFRACPGETVTLSIAEGSQPVLGNDIGQALDYVRYEGFVIHGGIYRLAGKGAEVAYCEVIGQFVDTSDNHDGIRIERADGAWIHHNIIRGVKGKSHNSSGIKVYKSENLIIEDNYLYDNTCGIFDKDSGTNNTYRRNFLTGNDYAAFHGNNQGKYMKVSVYDNVIDGSVSLGYLVDGTEVHDNLIRGNVLAGHWAGELWNTHLWNNVVISSAREVTAYKESKNKFVNEGDRRHLRYMDYNIYTAPPRYRFGEVQTFTLEQMRAQRFEEHSSVVKAAGDIYADERSYGLLARWKTAGRYGDAVGPDDVAQVLDTTRYGPAGRAAK